MTGPDPGERLVDDWAAGDPPARGRLLAALGLGGRVCRLFVAACGRSPAVWPHLGRTGQAAVEFVEYAADHRVTEADARSAWQPGTTVIFTRLMHGCATGAVGPAEAAAAADSAAAYAALPAQDAARLADEDPADLAAEARRLREAERRRQGRLLVAMARPGWRFDPAWRTSAARSLASAIYADKAWGRLPVLADALEEAGGDPAYLAHARDPALEGFRGEWLVDHAAGLRG